LGHSRGVDLITPTEVIHSEYRVVFVVGLTQAAFPSSSARLAFTRTINDAHPDFESTDVRQRAQYGLGLLPGSTDRVVFSHPHHNADGDETVAAEFLAELQRICDDDSQLRETRPRGTTRRLTSREDVQREIGAALATSADATPAATSSGVEATLDTITDAGVFDTAPGNVPKRIRNGVRCATSRRSAKTTGYDGWIRPDTRRSLDETDGEFSPSRITEYAECGFKYYMSEILEYGGDPDHAFDPNSSEKGSFVHRVIARFFSMAQSSSQAPVEIEAVDDAHGKMYRAVQDQLQASDITDYDSAFSDGFLTRLLAGLDPDSTDNSHAGQPGHHGIFAELLESFQDEQDQLTIRPVLHEATIGGDRDEDGVTTSLKSDSVELIDDFRVSGRVDRVDTVVDTDDGDDEQFVAIDYKTGYSPSISEVIGGVSFQLPLYLRMISDALGDDSEPIGATYYDIDIPSKARIKNSPLASEDYTSHFNSKNMALPHTGNAPFETHSDDGNGAEDSFMQFIHDTTDNRLKQISAAIDDGVFHPTILDESTAGCKHCDFSHVCGIQHHRREERVEALSHTGTDRRDPHAYIPAHAESAQSEGEE
jgi:hypothetical protein